MSGFNMPPGVSPSDIPGNGPDLAPMPCPSCGEQRMDFLGWTEDEAIVCETCTTTFDPNAQGAYPRPTIGGLETPPPKFQLGAVVDHDSWSRLTVHGLRLQVSIYEEDWATDESPSTLHPAQPVWEYRLMRLTEDRWGNQQWQAWGWANESELRRTV